MSDEIDIPITVTGGAGIDQITTSIDRLSESMLSLGNTSPALDRLNEAMATMQGGLTSSLAALTQSMADMKQVMATGFADISATNTKLIEAMGARQVRAIEAAGEAAATATAEAGLKIKAADARTWEQIQRGSAANVTGAFNQLAQGIPVEAVTARYGELATAAAASLDGQLAKLRQFQENSKSLFLTDYKPLAGATKADQIVDHAREEELAVRWQKMLQETREKELAGEALFNSAVARMDAERVAARTLDYAREEELAVRWEQMLQAQRDKELEGEALFARTQAEMAAKRIATAEAAAERQRALNASYLSSSPAAQVRTATQAQVYGQMGGDAEARYGSAAAGAGALAAAEARLAASAGAAGAAHLEMNDVLRQAEGAFRGAAHQAGIYGLHHGQLIALLAGGAVAAALHHIAETGAEVEFQLASLNALSGSMTPVDMNKFIGISAGTMTSLKDAAEGMHALAQAGQTEQQAFAALPDVMRLASLGEMSVAQAAEMAVESMHAFGKEITDLGQIGDILVAVGSKSNVSVHTLAEDMKSAAVTGAMFNLNMEEITATVGALAERGLTIQPLSSALMKLYEPSDKTAKAMQHLGLTTKDSTGNLKDYTQFMGELTDKIAQFKVPADVFKQLGMSSRDSKAIEVMTQHFSDYKHLLEEAEHAQGKMFDAMTAKEDTVEGSWKRLGSTVEGSLTKAFMDASPIIRQVEEDLMRVAGSSGTVSALSNLAAGVARLTQTFVENAGTLALMVAGYTGLRMISSLTTMVNEFVVAQRAATIVGAEAAAITRVETAQLELFAVAENTAAVGATRLAGGLEVAAAGSRLLTTGLGWIGVAIVGATALFDLLTGSMEKSDAEHQKQQNTYNTTTDAIQREIDRLKELEEQLLKTGKAGTVAAAQVSLGFAQAEEAKARGNLEGAQESTPVDTSLRMAGRHGPTSRNGDQMKSDAITAAEKALAEAHARTVATQNMLAELETRQENVAAIESVNNLRKKVGELPDHVDPFAKTAAAREAAAAANEHLKALKGQEVTELNVVQLTKDLKQVQDEITATKLDVVKAPNEKDAARAEIEVLQERLRLRQMDAKSELENLASQNKRGELGDLQLINEQLRVHRDLNLEALKVAVAEKGAAGPLSASQQMKYDSKIKTASNQFTVDENTAIRARADLLDRMDTQELQHRAQTLRLKGELDKAFDLEYEAKYGSTLDKLDEDIADADNVEYRGRLIRFRNFLGQLKEEGEKNAIFKMDENDFNADLEKIRTRLNDLKLQTGAGTGLSAVIGNQMLGSDAIRAQLPQLMEDQKVMEADAGNDPVKQKAATAALRHIQDLSAQLRQEWVGIGDTIGEALSQAFGKGGAALGGMISAATHYGAEIKNIQSVLADSGGGAAAQKKAADDTAAAQVKAYGDMTSAAKGFFAQNTAGYKVLHAAEQAFRVYELTMAVANAAKKIMLEGGVVAAVLGGEEAKASAVSAGTQVQLAADLAKGESAAAVAVATQAQGDPYSAWPRMAAMAAAMAALGFAVFSGGGGGGGGQSVSQQRQAENGTGTIAGDPKAKSDSIAKSLAAIDKNTYDSLNVSQGMLSSLRMIEANITNFAGRLLQNTNISTPEISLSQNNGLATTAMTGGIGAIGYMAGAGLSAFTSMAAIAGPLGLIAGLLVSKLPIFGKIATAIFGGKESLNDSGFTLSPTTLGQVAASGVSAQSYADIHTSGGLFRHSSDNVKLDPLSTESERQIAQIILGLGDTIKTAAGILGVSGDAFDAKLNGFVVDIGKISLKGLSAADQQKAIETAFSKLGDQMATSAFATVTQFSKAGEGALETLTRIATDYQAVDAVFKSFGTAFSAVGTESIAAREKLIDLAGGLDKFTSQADFFFKNFLTQGQQTAATRASIQPTLDKYGLSADGANAVATFAKVAISFGAMGAAGAEAYTELMNIAPAFKAVTDVAKDMQQQIDDLLMTQAQKDAAQRATLDPANQALFDQLQQAKAISQAKSDLVSAYENESQAIQSTIDKMKSLSLSLHGFVNSLQLGNLSPLNPADQYGAALSLFNDTLAKAKAGDANAQSSLQSVAQSFLQASRTANASNSTYQSDYQRVVAATTAMADWADKQVTDGQTSLNALHDQVGQLVTLNGTSLSVLDAIQNLNVILTKGQDKNTNTSALASIYQELLGRTPDQPGLDFWDKQLKNGVSLPDIIDAIKHSAEYADHQNKLGATSSVTPSTQYGADTNSSLASLTTQVTTLYQQYMKHAPDQAGLDYWIKQLQSGVSITAVAAAIQNSPEAATKASTTVTAPAATTVTAPKTTTVTAPAASASTSLASQVAALYQQYLGRTADQAGVDYWVKQLQSGTSMSAVADAIKGSAEAAAPKTSVTQAAPATGSTSGGGASVDPYAAAIAQNAQVVAQLAKLNAQIDNLRTDQQAQADQQVTATMTAGASTGSEVAAAVQTSAQAAAWAAQNKVALR